MSRFLEDITEFVKKQPFNVIRISEVQGDGEIETAEFTPANPCQNCYSISKLFTVTAIGILWDRGLLRLDETLGDIFEGRFPENADERLKGATVEMALTHRLGFPPQFLDIDVTHASEFGKDFLSYALSAKLEYAPGEGSIYTDGAYYVLSRIVSEKTGTRLDDFLWEEFFFKAGFAQAAWAHCPEGCPIGATGLYIGSEDIVKLGMLYRDGGLYRGERILSEEWVNRAIEKDYSIDFDPTHRIYFKGGMCGQKVIVAPEQNRVVALQSYGADSDVIAAFVRDYE